MVSPRRLLPPVAYLDVGRRCDFCGDVVTSVRRVALDQEYDRLQKAHKERYSCADCFEKKERSGWGSRGAESGPREGSGRPRVSEVDPGGRFP